MDKLIKNKKGLALLTSHSSGYKIVQKDSFFSYILFDQV